MSIIKFALFLALIDNKKTQSLFFKANNFFASCCKKGMCLLMVKDVSGTTVPAKQGGRAAIDIVRRCLAWPLSFFSYRGGQGGGSPIRIVCLR
jgi:hypothetical protein